MGIHTALDTAGLLGSRLSDDDLNYVDLTLLDIKSGIPETYERVTGRQLQPTLDFATRLSGLGKTMWIRFVLVPGLTDAEENVEAIAAFVETLDCVQRLEVLPFHQLGRDKWEATGEPYLLEDTRAADARTHCTREGSVRRARHPGDVSRATRADSQGSMGREMTRVTANPAVGRHSGHISPKDPWESTSGGDCRR